MVEAAAAAGPACVAHLVPAIVVVTAILFCVAHRGPVVATSEEPPAPPATAASVGLVFAATVVKSLASKNLPRGLALDKYPPFM